MSRQIALIGRCDNTRSKAPFGSPDWEVWGLGRDELLRADMLFEPHVFWNDPKHRERHAKAFGMDFPSYLHWLNANGVPVVVSEDAPELKNAVVFPREAVLSLVGGSNAIDPDRRNARRSGEPYLESTFAYMLAYAIHLHAEGEPITRIGLWGIDLDSASEWAYQRPNAEYLIGFARGRGIDVHIPKEAHLTRSFWSVGRYGLKPNGDSSDLRPEKSQRKEAA